jgi:hypothetical protein
MTAPDPPDVEQAKARLRNEAHIGIEDRRDDIRTLCADHDRLTREVEESHLLSVCLEPTFKAERNQARRDRDQLDHEKAQLKSEVKALRATLNLDAADARRRAEKVEAEVERLRGLIVAWDAGNAPLSGPKRMFSYVSLEAEARAIRSGERPAKLGDEPCATCGHPKRNHDTGWDAAGCMMPTCEAGCSAFRSGGRS